MLERSRTWCVINVTLLLMLYSSSSFASLSLNATRYIIEGGHEEPVVIVNNNSDKEIGGQVWIEDAVGSDNVDIVASPSYFKLGKEKKQQIRLINLAESLNQDKETLYKLNVQEIPLDIDNNGSFIAFALRTIVKVIYRPEGLSEGRLDAESSVKYRYRDGKIWIKNPTPYYFAVTKVEVGKKTIELTDEERNSLTEFKPFSESVINIEYGEKLNFNKVVITAINDWGGNSKYEISKVH